MQEIRGINHVGIRVANLHRSRAFYEQLGFVFIAGPSGPEPVAIMQHPCGVNINFILNCNVQTDHNMLMDEVKKYSGYTHMALDVTDIQRVQTALQQLAISITEGPVTLPDGAVMLFIRDPDRNVIEFHQAAP